MSSIQNLEYRYADGNGNIFSLTTQPELSLVYQPVAREHSSSGVYDGGPPAQKRLSPGEWTQVHNLFAAAIGNSSIHIEQRRKGSACIITSGQSGRNSYYLRGDAAGIKELEAYLRTLLV